MLDVGEDFLARTRELQEGGREGLLWLKNGEGRDFF